MAEKSLALIGNASGQVLAVKSCAPAAAPGIFDKETRRKAMAVAGAAMELKARTGFDR